MYTTTFAAILSVYFINSIVQVSLSKNMWSKQLDVPNEKIFMKSGMLKRKSVESQKDEQKGKLTSLFILKERTEIVNFIIGF